MATSEDLAVFAETIVASLRDWPTATLRGRTFKRTTQGMCSQFVRKCTEGVLNLADQALGGKWFGGSAKETEYLLSKAGKRTDNPRRGDIVCFNKNSGSNGHIGILLGGEKFAENTSSKSRGPGTVISDLDEMRGRITGYYEVLPHPQPRLVVMVKDGPIVACNPVEDNNRIRCNVRELAEALGYAVDSSQYRQGRIILSKREN